MHRRKKRQKRQPKSQSRKSGDDLSYIKPAMRTWIGVEIAKGKLGRVGRFLSSRAAQGFFGLRGCRGLIFLRLRPRKLFVQHVIDGRAEEDGHALAPQRGQGLAPAR